MNKTCQFPSGISKQGFLLGLFCCVFLAGCFSSDFQASYKEKDIPEHIKKICREEFNLDVLIIRSGKTLWVYSPQERLLHAEFGKNPEKIFDEGIIDKARNILTSISRVLLSSDNAPEYFVLVISDINSGMDYFLTAKLEDIKKSASGGLPWSEANKRYVFGFEQNIKAIGDVTGAHLNIYDIKWSEFLSRQIMQRVRMVLQEERIKKYLAFKEANAGFRDKEFVFEYTLERVSEQKGKINISDDILNVITYCFKTYEFKDFSRVVIKSVSEGQSSIYENKDIWARPIE